MTDAQKRYETERHALFFKEEACKKLYKDHVTFMVNRVNSYTGKAYKNDPTILAWNLINEPRCETWVPANSWCPDALAGWFKVGQAAIAVIPDSTGANAVEEVNRCCGHYANRCCLHGLCLLICQPLGSLQCRVLLTTFPDFGSSDSTVQHRSKLSACCVRAVILQEMAAHVKSADRNHLVTSGAQEHLDSNMALPAAQALCPRSSCCSSSLCCSLICCCNRLLLPTMAASFMGCWRLQ